MSARLSIVLLVVLAHGIVLWLFWRVRTPVNAEIETFTSILFFLPAPYQRVPAASTTPAPRRPSATVPRPAPARGVAPAPAEPADSTAITLPAPTLAPDFVGELAGAAAATLAKEKKTQEQLGALLRKYRREDDPRDPHPAPQSSFRWYEAGIHRFDTRGPLPVWHLNDHCVLLALIIPACLIGHIEIHGDLFNQAAAAHDEKLATPRPNDAP